MTFFESWKITLIKIVTNLMMSGKLSTLGLLERKTFWNKGYDAITFVHDLIKKYLLHDSNYFLDVVSWPKFGNSSISMWEVIITSTSQRFELKKHFFELWYFKLNNLGLALGMAFKFDSSVAKQLRLKVRKVWKLIPMFL